MTDIDGDMQWDDDLWWLDVSGEGRAEKFGSQKIREKIEIDEQKSEI